MKALTSTLVFTLLLFSSPAMAQNAQTQLLTEVYATDEERLTLYCQTPFSPDSRTRVERIYPQRTLLDHFGCENARSCEMNADYLVIWNDMHQMFPITAGISRLRRGTTIDDTRLDAPNHECDIKITFQTFEPADSAKGDVARAMLYLHQTYQIPLVGRLEVWQEWNKIDPPSEFEKLRNERITKIQGTSNKFIDNPSLAEKITLEIFGF